MPPTNDSEPSSTRVSPSQVPDPAEDPWATPDEALVEAAAGGERLVASIRLYYYLVLSLVPVALLLSLPGAPGYVWISLTVALVSVALSFVLKGVAERGVRVPGIAIATTLYDIVAVSTVLVLVALTGRPLVAANSQVLWGVYLLLIAMTSIRFDLRLCLLAGLASSVTYGLVVAWIATTWDLVSLGESDPGYAGFGWATQFGRIVLMMVATALAAGMIARSRRLIAASGTDRLTGLANRALFEQRLFAEIARVERRGGMLALAFIDLDHFKEFNDRYGHATGDAALRAVAHAFAGEVRAEDVLARWGGEEFVLVMPGTRAAQAVSLLERVRRTLRDTRLGAADARGLGFSAGLAEYPADGPGAHALLEAADRRMIEAKRSGRDRTVLPSSPAAQDGGA